MGYTKVHALKAAIHEAVNQIWKPCQSNKTSACFSSQIYEKETAKKFENTQNSTLKKVYRLEVFASFRYTLMCKSSNILLFDTYVFFVLLSFCVFPQSECNSYSKHWINLRCNRRTVATPTTVPYLKSEHSCYNKYGYFTIHHFTTFLKKE